MPPTSAPLLTGAAAAAPMEIDTAPGVFVTGGVAMSGASPMTDVADASAVRVPESGAPVLGEAFAHPLLSSSNPVRATPLPHVASGGTQSLSGYVGTRLGVGASMGHIQPPAAPMPQVEASANVLAGVPSLPNMTRYVLYLPCDNF